MNLSAGQQLSGAVDFEFTPEYQGLYVLDTKGGIHPRGETPQWEDDLEVERWDFNIARDLEVSADGLHLYLLDGYGGIHHRGPRENEIESSEPHYWSGWDIIRDIEFNSDGNTLILAAGTGSLQPFGATETEYRAELPYPEWDYLVDIEFDPATESYTGLDSNGRLYSVKEAKK